jgi:hypothetical protein
MPAPKILSAIRPHSRDIGIETPGMLHNNQFLAHSWLPTLNPVTSIFINYEMIPDAANTFYEFHPTLIFKANTMWKCTKSITSLHGHVYLIRELCFSHTQMILYNSFIQKKIFFPRLSLNLRVKNRKERGKILCYSNRTWRKRHKKDEQIPDLSNLQLIKLARKQMGHSGGL